MPQIPTTYTGLNSGAAPIYTGTKTERAMERSVDRTLGRQRQLEQERHAGEKEFIDALSVDTISFASEQSMLDQSRLIEDYIDTWSKVYQEKGGTLSMQDKALMAADKQRIVAEQGQRQASNQQYLQASQAFRPDKHDVGEFQRRVNEHLQTGKVPDGGFLVEAPMPYDEYMGMLSQRAKSVQADVFRQPSGNKDTYVEVSKSQWETDKARQDYFNTVQSDSRAVKSLSNRFMESTDRQAYLDRADKNNDGITDPAERENAILEFGWDVDAKPTYMWKTTKEKSHTVSSIRETQESPEFQLQTTLNTGRGTGLNKSTFTAEEGLSGKIGVGVPGVKFNMQDYDIPLPVSAIDPKDVPKTMDLPADAIDAKLSMVANGKAEWLVEEKTYNKVPAKEARYLTDRGYRLNSGYEQITAPDGTATYYKTDKKVHAIPTNYDDVSGIINNYFDHADALIRDRGFHTESEKKDTRPQGGTTNLMDL